MPTGLCRYADRSQPVCRPVSAGMPTGLSRYADRSLPVCRPVSAGMPTGLSRYADRSLPVCRPVSAGMPSGLSQYADRSLLVCGPVSAGMPTGLCRYLACCVSPAEAGTCDSITQFACKSSGLCISKTRLMDGVTDCRDNSDEGRPNALYKEYYDLD